MKILVHSPLALFSPRLHLLLSVMQESIDGGDEVVFIGCDGSLPACAPNLFHSDAICNYCIARKDKGLRLVTGNFSTRHVSDYLDVGTVERILGSADEFDSIAELKSLRYEGVDVGYAALSSYIHNTREADPDLSDPAVKRSLQQLMNTAKMIYEAYTKAMSEENPDRVVLFNGRLAIDRAILRVCSNAGVECRSYEVTQKDDFVTFYPNTLPHDLAFNQQAAEKLWNDAPPDRNAVAESFFEDRRRGVFTNDRVYVDRQVAGKLPASWTEERKNIAIFNSSEDEWAAIDREWENNIYRSQAEGVDRLCQALVDDRNIHFYLRLHPNLRGMDQSWLMNLNRLGDSHRNLTLIPAESDVSSYMLLDRANVIVTFGSTVGLEAIYWNKPSILLNTCWYGRLGATYNPSNHDEAVEMIRADLPIRDRTPALIAAYYLMRRGFKQPYYEGDRRKGYSKGFRFKGDRIRVRGLTRLRYQLAKNWHG